MVESVGMNGRSEGQIMARSGIPIVLGDATYALRPLTMAQAEQWEERILALIGENLGRIGGLEGQEGLKGLIHASIDGMLDALYAYDELGAQSHPALPARATIRSIASRMDVYDALRKLVQHEFPPLNSAQAIGTWVPAEVREIITKRLMLLGMAPEPSTKPSSTTIPGPVNRAARRRSAKS